MLQGDFVKLDGLPDAFSLELEPPAVLLDARFSLDGKDVHVNVKSPDLQQGLPYNQLEVVSGNANFRSLGVRPGDTIKLYMFPDSETRMRQQTTGEVDAQMVNHEATDLIVAQVLDDSKLQIVGAVMPPRDLEVRIPEQEFAKLPGMKMADLDRLRADGMINAFGVKLSAAAIPLDQLSLLVPSIAWPPRIEIWRVRDDRMRAIQRSLGGYARNGEPALGWQPAPDSSVLAALVESFNRWLRSRKDFPQLDPPGLLESLPASLLENKELSSQLSPEALNQPTFFPHEGQDLQEAAWRRDIGRWAAGDSFDALPRARRLFDWTVRHVTLTDSPRVFYHQPWDTLLYGQGTAAKRAWVFDHLCRQQGILSCVIEAPQADAEADPWLWCGIEDHGQLYLFDPQLGLEIPAGDTVATLEQVVSDDSILRDLDLDDEAYPITSELAKQASVCVVAEPLAMSARAAELDRQQSGESALRLSLDVDAISARLAELPGVEKVVLWRHPFDNLRRLLRLGSASSALAEKTRSAAAVDFQPFAWRPRLWKARMLHLRGIVESERDARKKGVLYDPVHDHRAAAQLYLDRRVRPSERVLKTLESSPERLAIYRRSKANATYWLGVLKEDMQDPKQSLYWLEND
ncbi:MAG: hypothetical protein KDA37_02970, partial [Planctomycetales bacterium]|nr:hypothetical protein [Planctomycetales bacterium]